MSCDKCGKQFTNNRSISYHIRNKVCEKVSNTCVNCGRKFTTKQSLRYHIDHKVCTLSNKPKIALKSKVTDYYKLSNGELIERLLEKEVELKAKDVEIKVLKEHPQTVNNQYNIVFPVAYGDEDLSRIEELYPDWIGQIVKGTGQYIPKIAKMIHCNPSIKEHHTAYIPGHKTKFAKVSDGCRWIDRPKDDVIDEIIEKCNTILGEYVDENGDKMGEKISNRVGLYREAIDGDDRARLRLEICAMLLNMKEVICRKDKELGSQLSLLETEK